MVLLRLRVVRPLTLSFTIFARLYDEIGRENMERMEAGGGGEPGPGGFPGGGFRAGGFPVRRWQKGYG
jgi:hypothetical protein